MIKTKDLNNKVYLCGTILNSIRQKYNKDTDEQYVYFTLSVDRQGYPTIYNHDEHNYFYCYASERLMGGEFLDKIRKNFNTFDNVCVYGVLDNIQQKSSQSNLVNGRALQCYLSTICIIDMKPYAEKPTNSYKENLLLINARKEFGKNININVSPDAFDKDYNGLETDNLPDY